MYKFFKLALIIITPFLIWGSVYPAYKFYQTFHSYEFSTNNQDWANAGSFFGGMYSAIFSFASILILSVTLVLTKKYNNKQLEILNTSHRISIFTSLFDKLMNKMDSINYYEMGIYSENDYFRECENELLADWASIRKNNNHEIDAGSLLELSRNIFNRDWYEKNNPYYDVILITRELLIMFNLATEAEKSFFLAYMEANSSTRRLWWLFCYLMNKSELYVTLINKNMRLLRVPQGYL
ncbi:hypothetical protein [Pantoea agglomerans]|uniref:hypothetical protein n=1 Tax=Enterobacter agglomerans TaxID=549 RepID=UPI003C7EBBBC